jgi:hypothetical protein
MRQGLASVCRLRQLRHAAHVKAGCFSEDEMVTTRTIDIHTHILTQETAALLSQAGAKVTITPDDAELAALDVGGVV